MHKENGMLTDKQLNFIRVLLFVFVVVTWSMYLTGCSSAADKRDYRDSQVEIISSQSKSRASERSADAAARVALYQAMAAVAQSSPESADAIAVALAISSVNDAEDDTDVIATLHREESEAVKIAQAVGPALITTIGTVAVAGYQSSVSKNNSNNAALVALGDSASDAQIMKSVTDMAAVGLDRGSVNVGGDYTTVGNDMDQSMTSTVSSAETSSVTTTTETTTETTTDSYNETTYTTTDGTNVSLEDIEALLGAGLRITVVIDGEEVEVTQCEDTLTFGGEC